MDSRYQSLASEIAQHAEQRRADIEKEKLEKAAIQWNNFFQRFIFYWIGEEF